MVSGLVRDVIERHNPPSSPRLFPPNDAGSSFKTGFPPVQHRMKTTSAFKQGRLDQRVHKGLSASRERISNVGSEADDMKRTKAIEDSMGHSLWPNIEAVEWLTEEERERERQDIRDQLGPGIDDLMKKVREARARRADSQATVGQWSLHTRCN